MLLMKIGLVLLFLLMVSACSMRRLAMNYHSYLAVRTADNYLDLTAKQKDVFKKHWASFSSDVSKSHIEGMAQNIEALGVTENPSEITERLQTGFADLLAAGCDEFSPLMAQLSSEQIKHLRRKIIDRNKKFDPNENGGLAKYRKSKQEEGLARMKEWLGSVSTPQERIIKELDTLKDDAGQWENNYISYSQEAQEAFLSLLQASRGDADSLEKKCTEFVRNPDIFLSEKSKRTKEQMTAHRRRLLQDVFASINESQRIHLVSETKKLAQDLRGWASGVIEKK